MHPRRFKEKISVCLSNSLAKPTGPIELKLSTTLADIHICLLPFRNLSPIQDGDRRPYTHFPVLYLSLLFTIYSEMTWLKYGSSPQVYCHRRHVKERLRRSVTAQVLSDGQIVTELLTVSQRFGISTTQRVLCSERCQWFSL